MGGGGGSRVYIYVRYLARFYYFKTKKPLSGLVPRIEKPIPKGYGFRQNSIK